MAVGRCVSHEADSGSQLKCADARGRYTDDDEGGCHH